MRDQNKAWAALAAMWACLALGFAGCRSAPTPVQDARPDRAGAVPSDLSVDLAVRLGFGVGERPRIEERPARLVLLADGTLCGATERVPTAEVRPPRIRRLSREQLGEVWGALVASGFAAKGDPDARGNLRLLRPAAGEVLVTLEVHADGVRHLFARRFRPEDEKEAAMRTLVRQLAALAWASDEVLLESAEIPTRYDLGRDPYARFAPRGPSGDAGGAR